MLPAELVKDPEQLLENLKLQKEENMQFLNIDQDEEQKEDVES
jgi:hypothetical protein